MAARPALLLCVAALLTAGCGASAVGPSAQQSAAAGGASASSAAGPIVTRAHVDQADSTIVVDVAVTGPLTLQGGCQPTLAAHLVDPAGAALAEPTPSGLLHCLAITEIPIASGETREFTASLPLPAGHGRYTVEGRLAGGGDIPAVTLQV